LLLATTTAPRASGVPTPGCTTGGLVPVCTVLRPQVAALTALDGADQSGDGRFSVTDLVLLSGSGSVLNALLGGGADTDSSLWAEQMLNAVAAGPVLTEGTPMADDALLYLRALATAERAEQPVSTPRRAARLTP